MTEMRRKDREISSKEEIIAVIERNDVLRLGMYDGEEVYVVPMNYGYSWENGMLTFYFHGALQGRKFDIMRKNPKLCFELDCDYHPYSGSLPCQYGSEFTSVIGNGTAVILEDPAEKAKAMEIMMKHIAKKDMEVKEKWVSAINVFKLEVTSFTGKRRLHQIG